MLASFLAPSSVSSVLDKDGATISRAVEAVDAETARAACALVLAVLFSGRAARNFSGLDKMGRDSKARDEPRASLRFSRVLGLLALTTWALYRYG